MSGRIWIGAALASVVLHGAGVAAIALSTEPQEPPDQNVPKSQFSIEAAEVPRSRAAPEAPKAEAATQSETSSTSAQSGAIPLSRAEPVAPRAQSLAADLSDAPAIAATAPLGTQAAPITASASATLPSVAAPQATVVSSLEADALEPTRASRTRVVSSPSPTPTQLASLSVSPAIAAAVSANAVRPIISAPAAPTLPATAPDILPTTLSAPTPEPTTLSAAIGAQAAAATPVSAPAPSAAPDTSPSDALPLPALAGKAALAWSGEDDTAVSATSLAAIAAFTQAGDLQASSAKIRDGIEGILAAVPCARLQTTFLPETGQLELRGHIPQDDLRGPVLAALQEQVGDAIELSDQLLILPRPQCGALSGIAAVGLPQSTEQLTSPAVIGEDGFARNYTYVDGERLQLDLTAPDYDSYIYMDYFVADGSVIHLQPNEIVPLEFATAKSAQSVGRSREGKPFLELTVSPPFGQEIAAAFAASVPLYDEPRPIQEPAEAYLQFLKERVAAARAAHPDFKGEWVYFFISTEAG